ncbi:MAG: glycosyltransferase [Deferribacteres bacterium]|nr:glycosyltransferase [candidate division KSB1 bacterium]MCB9501802.1 glycosyltransferase [Deferribacteres bacterium]
MKNKEKKLLAIAFIYPPMARAGVHRSVRFVRFLKELGWQISVLTPDEKYYPPQTPVDHGLNNKIPEGIVVSRTAVFQGMYKLFNLKVKMGNEANGQVKDERDKEKIAPISHDELTSLAEKIKPQKPVTKKSKKQALKDFIFDLFTLPDKEVFWLPYALFRGWRLHRHNAFNIIYSTAPPFTDHLVALFLKKLSGKPWIADFRDPWARAPMKKQELSGTFRGRAIHFFERKFVQHADKIILNTDWAHTEFMQFYKGKAAAKFVVINNGFDPEDFENLTFSEMTGVPAKLRITHTGALYRMRDPGAFFQALSEVIDEGVINKDEIEVNFVGIIARELYNSFSNLAHLEDVVKVYPPVSHEEALRFQAQADVLLALQPGTNLSIPGKIFEYIALRKYIFAVTIPGATADLVKNYHLGSVVDPQDFNALKQELVNLVQKWRQNQLSVHLNGAYDKFNGRNQSRELHDLLTELLERR